MCQLIRKFPYVYDVTVNRYVFEHKYIFHKMKYFNTFSVFPKILVSKCVKYIL